jgi:16S rRNA (guanine(1405)-N(7))-methyltransferase
VNPSNSQRNLDPAEGVLASRKYHDLNIPLETARDLYDTAIHAGQTPKEAEKTLRQKLHNIVAPYLGDPDFIEAASEMGTAFADGDLNQIKTFCLKMLDSHASTRERVEVLEEFYPRLFELTGKPGSIYDLAAGMNPFSLPWMNLDAGSRYFAYDLNAPRIELIQQFLSHSGRDPLAYHRDILIHPPEEKGDVAFLFKEAHRMEQRQRGYVRKLIEAVDVIWFLLSLPTSSLQGKFDLTERQRRLVNSIVDGSSWQVIEVPFKNELIFCIRKVPQ